MKSSRLLIVLSLVALVTVFVVTLMAADRQPTPRCEYVTIRWGGVDNTHVIRPGGLVEFIGPELRKLQKPDRADSRSFYMNCAMNGLTKEGYEFAGTLNDDIIMSKAPSR